MQIALTMKHAATGFGRPLYVRAIDWRGPRPSILLHEHPTDADDNATVEVLDVILNAVIEGSTALTGYRIETRGYAHVVEG